MISAGKSTMVLDGPAHVLSFNHILKLRLRRHNNTSFKHLIISHIENQNKPGLNLKKPTK